jgi:hypothetical protein
MLIVVGVLREKQRRKNEHPEFNAAGPENAEENGHSGK